MLSAHQMSLVTYTLLVVSLLACYFHGFKHSVGVKIGVDDWTAKDLQVFFYKQGKVNLETSLLEDLGLNGHALFDNHVIDDAFLQSKMNLGRELDRKNILKAIEQLDDELTHRPKDLFEWRVSNRRLFRYISSLGLHGQVLWFRWYDHPGALDQFDQYIDDMPAVQFWTIWLFAPSYFHYKIALVNDLHNSYMDEFLVWYYGIRTAVVVLSYLTAFLAVFKGGNDIGAKLFGVLFAFFAIVTAMFWLEIYWFCYAWVVHEYLYAWIPNWIDDFCFLLHIYFVGPYGTLKWANDSLMKFAVAAGFFEEEKVKEIKED